jgi:hypothetical protein
MRMERSVSGSPLPRTLRIILGRNPGLRIGRGTNTYLLGSERLILIDGKECYELLA